MSSTAFNLSQRNNARIARWRIGTYLTDGLRLLCVIDLDGEGLQLEDACTECLERWSLDEAIDSMREVKPAISS